MQIDLTHVSWHDVLLLGIAIGIWIGQRGRRVQGERIGALEKAIAKALGVTLGGGGPKEGK
jgi:hypothetical protein